MLKKTLFLLLFSLIYSQIVNLDVFKLKDYENITINKQSSLICYELHKDFKTNVEFYLQVNCDEADKTMSKTIYYNLTDESCQNLNNVKIDFKNIKSQFKYNIEEPKDSVEGPNGFFYDYGITKIDDNQKFLLLLLHDFTGKKFSISFAPISAGKIFKVLIALFLLFLSIIILACVFICIKCGRDKSASPSNPTQNSKKEEIQMVSMIPEDNIT